MRRNPRAKRHGSERGVILLLACFAMPVIISMLGLGVDLSVMYSLKARLQMACDGAAVAASRSLSLGQDSASQISTATAVAAQWFNANFAGNYLGATGTSVPAVTVVDDNVSRVRSITVTATTLAPTYFMKYWGRPSTLIGATGQTSRRDVVITLVLDRSGSMSNVNNSYNGLTPCQVMTQAAKQFTGMFQEGRDQIGLVTFGETIQVAQSPTTGFQPALGYTNSSGSATGALDQITCVGGTNTPGAVSLGWNELYKAQLPGALNALVVFTDGTPTAATFNFQNSMASSSGCLDSSGTAISHGGNMAANPRNWIAAGAEGNVGSTISLGTNSYFGPFSGPIGSLYSDFNNEYGLSHSFTPTGTSPTAFESTNSTKTSAESPGCAFPSSSNPTADISSVPGQDLYGNSAAGYLPVQGAPPYGTDKTTIGTMVYNLADNAANFARSPHIYTSGATMPGTLIFTIGLGGNGGVDFTLLQRMANDPNADPQGNYPAYPGYNQSQPVGTFIYSSDSSQLQAAFAKIGSMILRISK